MVVSGFRGRRIVSGRLFGEYASGGGKRLLTIFKLIDRWVDAYEM